MEVRRQALRRHPQSRTAPQIRAAILRKLGLQRKVAMPQRIPVQAKIPAQRNLMPPKSPAKVTYQAKPLRIAKRPQRRAATAP